MQNKFLMQWFYNDSTFVLKFVYKNHLYDNTVTLAN